MVHLIWDLARADGRDSSSDDTGHDCCGGGRGGCDGRSDIYGR